MRNLVEAVEEEAAPELGIFTFTQQLFFNITFEAKSLGSALLYINKVEAVL